ncbi:helix-turn-helix transcriptional regulator [Prauserella muralis]|uniref:Helix-turn-helix transcriptional regulator n=1 Tax=Prauserella muralis TaxID=588067 RepID=A0A2V4AQF2_9PSEU|nr:LuxR family transcriptional regulator [Prauserella muralis]PXY22853.1 helix-turn-helix transcriptional regulator [Prauserella muralis]TWE28607.1 LuxR family transcriptional regulator [Prauserella muralis]
MVHRRPPLIARAAALAVLDGAAARVARDGPGFALVSGPSGVGRTALVDELASRHEGPVLRAAGASWETGRAFGVTGQLAPGGDLVAGLGPGTTLAIVDDAHWADTESLQALVSTVRHDHEARLLVVATCVSGDPHVPAGALDLLHRAATTTVALEPLTAPEVGELAAARGVPLHPSMAERLCRHTGGLPRHVVHLLAEVPRSVWTRFDPGLPAPAAVAARVRESLAACSPDARRLAEAIAVLGPGTAVRDAASMAGVDGDVLPLLDEVCGAGLVELAPHGLTQAGPPDPMVRAAVLATMGPAASADAYRRAADLIDDPVRRMQLLVGASPVPDAAVADRLDELATQRAAEGAWGVAASLLSDASRLTDDRLLRERRLTRAVDALIGAGDAFAAAALIPEVESLRETPLRNAVLGYLAIVRGRATEAQARLGRAWDLVNSEREPDVAAMICQRYVLHSLCRCRAGDLVDWADRAVSLVPRDTPAAVEAAAIRGLGIAGLGRGDEALACYAELAERVQHGAQAQRILMGRGWLNLMVDALDDARADLESAVPTTFLGGSTRISLWARGWLARAQFAAGEWDEALRTVAEAEPLLDRSGIVLAGPLLAWTAVSVHALRGDWDRAEEAVRRADAGPQDYDIMRVPSCLARAQLAEARADSAGVLRALRPLTGPSAGSSIDEPGQWPWADLYAHALVLQGRDAEAESFLDRHERLAAARGPASARARLGAARGRLLAMQGEPAASATAFEAALGLLEKLPLRYDRARVSFAYGQALRRAGKRRDADIVISGARETFASLGASTYVARCDRELKAGGVHATRSGRAVGELTPQEEAVAQLVARGLSNREVAAELFVTMKTVQYHLTRIYAKLGVRSRAELAALRGHEQAP